MKPTWSEGYARERNNAWSNQTTRARTTEPTNAGQAAYDRRELIIIIDQQRRDIRQLRYHLLHLSQQACDEHAHHGDGFCISCQNARKATLEPMP